jgi:hypothetical protein
VRIFRVCLLSDDSFGYQYQVSLAYPPSSLALANNVEHPIASGLDREVLLPTKSPTAAAVKLAIDHFPGFSLPRFSRIAKVEQRRSFHTFAAIPSRRLLPNPT